MLFYDGEAHAVDADLDGRDYFGDTRHGQYKAGQLDPYSDHPYRLGGPTIPSGSQIIADDDTFREPGPVGRFVPVVGSGRSAIRAAQLGQYGKATLYGALAVSDVFLVKSLVTSGFRIAGKIAFEEAVIETATVAPRGGIGPVLKGQAGVERAIAQIEAEGSTVIGREITVEAGGVRTRPDLLIERFDGLLEFVEVKNGPNAGLSANQVIGFPAIRTGGGIPLGANATKANILVGTPLGPTPVRIIKFP